MNEYKMVIDFQRKIIFPNEIDLVVNDYNSTKLNFEFNQEAEKYLFKCLLSDESIYVDEIKNNELLLPKGLLQKEGLYKYQISAYGDDNRLTTYAEGILKVRNELVSTDEIVPLDDRIPILDKLINEVNQAIDEANNLDIEATKEEHEATITVTKKDGTTKEVKIYDGIDGEKGKDALINGVNTINIVGGENVTLNQEESTLIINAKDTIYDDTSLRNVVNQINEDLGKTDTKVQELENDIDTLEDTKADRTEIPDVSEFIKKTVNDLVNYYKKTETYTQQEVNNLIGQIKTVSMKVLPSRPEVGENNIIYLIPSTSQTTDNVYDEWIYVDSKWELIGTTEISLETITNDEIDEMFGEQYE